MDANDEATPARSPWLARFGGTVCVATLASFLASVPAALRLAGASDTGVVRAWLTTGGLLVAPMLLVVPLARLAREGLRGFSSSEGAGALERACAVIFFASITLWLAQTSGAMLRAHTHQRALGGVTFAVTMLVAIVVLAFVARRLARILTALRARRRAVGTAAAVMVSALALALVGLRISHAASALDDQARALLVDGVAIALSLVFFARKTFDDRRILARIGPPLAVVALVVSMHTLATQPQSTRALEQVCPVHFAVLKAFAHLAF
jgi:hypothetical protein